MTPTTTQPSIIFPNGFEERLEMEAPARGYLSDVVVQFGNGIRYKVFFYDPVRMRQDLEEYTKLGRAYLAEPNLILLPEVSTDNIIKAVHGLWKDGYFQHLKPLS
jgi:hypothetical protein